MPSISTTTRSVDPATTPAAATCPVCGSPVRPDGGCTSATCFNRVDAMSEATLAAMRPTLLRYATHLTGGNRDRAEDAVQEALTKAWTWRDQWAGVHNPAGWLMMLTRYAVMDVQAKDRRMVPVDFLPQTLADAAGEPEVSEVLSTALSMLTHRQAQAVVGRYVYGVPRKVLAEALGIADQTMNQHIMKALTRLRAAAPVFAELAGAR